MRRPHIGVARRSSAAQWPAEAKKPVGHGNGSGDARLSVESESDAQNRGVSAEPERVARLHRIVRWYLGTGVSESDPAARVQRELVVRFSLVGGAIGFFFSGFYLFGFHYALGGIGLFIFSFALCLLPLLVRWTGSPRVAGHGFAALLLCVTGFLAWMRPDLGVSALMYACAIPLFAIYLLGRGAAMFWLCASSLVVVAFAVRVAFGWAAPAFLARPEEILVADTIALVGLFVLVFAVSLSIDETRRLAAAERRRVEERAHHSRRLESIGMLAAGVAHEINNPLTYVVSNLEHLLEDGGSISDEAAAMVRDAHDGAIRVQRIVQDLRSYTASRDEVGGLVNMRRAIESALNLAQAELKPRARVDRVLSDVPLVAASEGRIVQVLVNLLVNAAQSIEGGADSNTVKVSLYSADGHVVAEVADTGTGIRPEHLEKIFDPFFTTKPIGVGTGLGLSVCRNIVQAFGGQIDGRNRARRGAVFRIRLPVAEDPTEVGRSSAEGGPGLGVLAEPLESSGDPRALQRGPRSGRVLVVDDEPLIGSAIRRILGGDHDVVVLASTTQAIERLRSGEVFDAILSDVHLPEATGADLFRWVQQHRPELTPRIAFMTGGVLTDALRDFLNAVDAPKLQKPVRAAELRRVVEGLVRCQER